MTIISLMFRFVQCEKIAYLLIDSVFRNDNYCYRKKSVFQVPKTTGKRMLVTTKFVFFNVRACAVPY